MILRRIKPVAEELSRYADALEMQWQGSSRTKSQAEAVSTMDRPYVSLQKRLEVPVDQKPPSCDMSETTNTIRVYQ